VGLLGNAVGQVAWLLLIHRLRGQARLPHLDSGGCGILGSRKIKCGGWLACDSGGSGGLVVTDTPPSRASPLPHLDCGGVRRFWSVTNKGGSWLACDSGGSGGLVGTDTPPSRASPLPHLGCGGCGDFGLSPIKVGAGLPAMAVGRAAWLVQIHRLRGQARSHIWIAGGAEILVCHR
jgi:hypothetical protein